MEKQEQIKCPYCGFKNIKGTRKCSKCRRDIDNLRKSCPKCGKINYNNVKLCVRCKYDFTKKKRTIWFNFLISLVLVGVLCLLVYFDKVGIVKKVNLALKVLAGFAIFVVFVKTLIYGEKDKINYSAEEEIVERQKNLNIMKKWCNVAIVIGAILVLSFLIYYYFIR